MIPKHIYYCWFGGKKLPKSVKRCISSWEKYCPDYEITQINEQNFDTDSHPYTAWCLSRRKYAFVSDYVRLKVIYDYGGIYLDTDVEMLKKPDNLLNYQCYFGFECKNAVNSGHGFGSEAGHPVLKAMLDAYDALVKDNKQIEPVICTKINTDAFLSYGLQLNGKTQYFDNGKLAVFSKDYFNPGKIDGVVVSTENTFSVHWFDASWVTPAMRLRLRLGKHFKKVFGDSPTVWLKKKLRFFRKS